MITEIFFSTIIIQIAFVHLPTPIYEYTHLHGRINARPTLTTIFLSLTDIFFFCLACFSLLHLVLRHKRFVFVAAADQVKSYRKKENKNYKEVTENDSVAHRMELVQKNTISD